MALSPDQIQTYGLWIQTGAIVASGIGVIYTVSRNVRIARRRATIDLLLAEQHGELAKERLAFIRLREDGNLVQWADPSKSKTDSASTVREMCNRYELVALGISEKTLDQNLYKKWFRTALVNDWLVCKPYITQLRHEHKVPTYFCMFEKLARKWATRDERQHT